MAKKKSSIKKIAAKPKTKVRKTKKSKKEKKMLKGMSREVFEYAKLVADPCHGPLVRSIGSSTGTGIVERVRSTVGLPANATDTCGYLAWFPSFHGTGTAANTPSNVYRWETTQANFALRPVNTIANPMGTTAATSGTFLSDPAFGTIATTSPFSRARTIAACMTYENIGTMTSIQGVVGSVIHISLSSFNMTAGASGFYQPPSVAEMLNYAAKRERVSVDGHEVIWAPTDRDSIMRTNGTEDQGTTFSGSSTDPNVAFWDGTPATSPTNMANPNPNDCMGIVFVWSSIGTAGTGYINVNLTKVVELELAPRGNVIEQKSITHTVRGPTLNSIIETLDTNTPNWRQHAVRMAVSAASSLTSAALAGTSYVANVAPAIMDVLV
nr:MAG: hypothetical protein 3 [Sobelivirales sp.]